MFSIPNRFFHCQNIYKIEKNTFKECPQVTSRHCFIKFTLKNSRLTFSRYLVFLNTVLPGHHLVNNFLKTYLLCLRWTNFNLMLITQG